MQCRNFSKANHGKGVWAESVYHRYDVPGYRVAWKSY